MAISRTSQEIDDAAEEIMSTIDEHELSGTSVTRSTTISFLLGIKSSIDIRIHAIKAERASDGEGGDEENDEHEDDDED
jgi:hypothetical protein